MIRTLSRALRVAVALALMLALAAPSGMATALPKAITRATSVRLESSCPVYIGNDGVGSTRFVQYSILPASATANKDSSLRYWSSDNTRIVTVSKSGELKAVNFGTTTVRLHLEDGTGLEAKCKVTVSKQPITSIKLNHSNLQRLPGTTYQLKATIAPSNAYSSQVKWTSSDTGKAKVTQTGYVRLYKPGTVRIKASAGSVSASCDIVIGYDFSKTSFRVYSIANYDYPDSIGKVPAFEPSASALHGMYREMYDEGGVKLIKGFRNQTGAQMRTILSELSTNPHITEDDVTVFFFSGRGAPWSTDMTMRGALLGIDADKPTGTVTIAEVQAKLDKIPGVVLLILDSHLAGQWITSKGAQNAQTASDFNRAVIDQFSRSAATNYNPKAIEGATKSKYKIFTACTSLGRPYGYWDPDEETGYAFFGKAVSMAYAGAGDYNKDGIISLREAAHYAYARVNSFVKSYNKKYKKSVSQKVSVWPTNDYSPVFVLEGGDFDDDDDGEFGDDIDF